MASQKFFIIKNNNGQSDGIVQTLDKNNIGYVYRHEAPDGHFFKVSLDAHWIITDEEYKQLNKIKKHEQNQISDRRDKARQNTNQGANIQE